MSMSDYKMMTSSKEATNRYNNIPDTGVKYNVESKAAKPPSAIPFSMPVWLQNLMPSTEKAKDFGKTALVSAAVAASIGAGEPAFAVQGNANSYRFTSDELASLTYEQVKGTGLANQCTRAVGEGSI